MWKYNTTTFGYEMIKKKIILLYIIFQKIMREKMLGKQI